MQLLSALQEMHYCHYCFVYSMYCEKFRCVYMHDIVYTIQRIYGVINIL